MENEIGEIIVKMAIYFYNKLGPELLESLFQQALAHTLTKRVMPWIRDFL